MVEDPCSFKQMFRMSVTDFKIVLQYIADLITPQKIQRGQRPIPPDERLALALRFLATVNRYILHLSNFTFLYELSHT